MTLQEALDARCTPTRMSEMAEMRRQAIQYFSSIASERFDSSTVLWYMYRNGTLPEALYHAISAEMERLQNLWQSQADKRIYDQLNRS